MKLSTFATDWYSADRETGAISPPIAMASAAGWYVGRIVVSGDDEATYPAPYDRLTHYMSETDALSHASWFREAPSTLPGHYDQFDDMH